jgi:hypothetical protein
MSQRQTELLAQQHEDFPGQAKLDDYPTPPWGTRALMIQLAARSLWKLGQSCWEPAANRGYMVRPLREYFGQNLFASDVHDYGHFRALDFLMVEPGCFQADWIITNPPFVLAEEFIFKALSIAERGVAVLVRAQFLETIGRYQRLFHRSRPTYVLQFVERLPMVKGRCDPEADTATAYCWLVWTQWPAATDTIFDWIPPCRHNLERVDDYPTVTA